MQTGEKSARVLELAGAEGVTTREAALRLATAKVREAMRLKRRLGEPHTTSELLAAA